MPGSEAMQSTGVFPIVNQWPEGGLQTTVKSAGLHEFAAIGA